MVTKYLACLKQTLSLLYFVTFYRWKTIEYWINIQVSNSVIKWCTGSHKKGFSNSWFRRFYKIYSQNRWRILKGEEIFLSEYFMKHSLMRISLHLILISWNSYKICKKETFTNCYKKKWVQERISVQFASDRVYIF